MILATLAIGLATAVSLNMSHADLDRIARWGSLIPVPVVIRFINPATEHAAAVPCAQCRRSERKIAHASELWTRTYELTLLQPLVGPGDASAAGYPIVGDLSRCILPLFCLYDPTLYALLSKTHPVLAYLFILMFLAHFSAVLFHTLIVRDAVAAMVPGKIASSDEMSRRAANARETFSKNVSVFFFVARRGHLVFSTSFANKNGGFDYGPRYIFLRFLRRKKRKRGRRYVETKAKHFLSMRVCSRIYGE